MLRPSATVELIMQDASGSKSAVTLFASSELAVSTIAANAEAFAAILAPLTGCVLVGERIRYKTAYEAGIVPDGPNLCSHAGVLFFSTEDSESATLINIPGISDDVFITDGPGAGAIIDLTNANISDLVTAVLDAGFCTPFAVPLLDVSTGYLQSRL